MDDDKNKAGLYKLYDFTKGGTNIVDQRMGFYICKFRSRKWSMVAFSYIVNKACMNSSTLFALNGIKDPLKQSSFEFAMGIVCRLVGSFIQQRNQSHLAPSIKRKIALVLDMMQLPNPAAALPNRAVGNFPPKSENKSRCYMCIEQLPLNRNQKSIFTIKLFCQACGKHTCLKDLVQKYEHCAWLFWYILSYFDIVYSLSFFIITWLEVWYI